jgi:hypothetical protein
MELLRCANVKEGGIALCNEKGKQTRRCSRFASNRGSVFVPPTFSLSMMSWIARNGPSVRYPREGDRRR